MTAVPARDRLVRAAASLFRRKGYDGVGLAEILAVSGLPKGSLYHHFPGGKSELARAATLSAGGVVEELVNDAFADAADFREGAVRTCRAIIGLAVQPDGVLACPVMSVLQAASDEPELRRVAKTVMSGWSACLAGHADRLGVNDARGVGEHLLALLQGAWILALAEQNGAPLERLATRLAAGEGARVFS
ncbi:TetR/AcrR family transcriptional regulator [Phyllobacterium salinisoli]|uniref:TetR/AcrR family transcriptional regulator n=1 Tax=Phyllobacterium salinisoli TaxID=1899321 RepID=A0A368JY69_9HYPH|nr:TetR/AcrR family transcriptional regulator [Phyllobacterium salinisoli]RCS22096.1 TetR/AcrR family transcriptional regulator [Phyllobacterium salinisoli]